MNHKTCKMREFVFFQQTSSQQQMKHLDNEHIQVNIDKYRLHMALSGVTMW